MFCSTIQASCRAQRLALSLRRVSTPHGITNVTNRVCKITQKKLLTSKNEIFLRFFRLFHANSMPFEHQIRPPKQIIFTEIGLHFLSFVKNGLILQAEYKTIINKE
jgi:hypothetical protein